MTNTELSERITRLEEVPFKRRTMAETQELNDLLILQKKRGRKKEARQSRIAHGDLNEPFSQPR